jgi:hypothetical protein
LPADDDLDRRAIAQTRGILMDKRRDFLGLPHEVVNFSGRDRLEIVLLRERVAARGDQLKVLSMDLLRES